ncbi:quinolinate synthase, L-aspartate oxidase (B protein) subunit [Burkholderiales bacterium]|nr:quinolinate synthase, L-aspartate oxidase (B protein) subunit [Burkholderiales bacterium]
MDSAFDVVIVGTGLAGLTAALRLADHRRILLVDKQVLGAGASDRAQGGIAAAVDPNDSIEAHVQDTLIAGAGLCDENATRFIIGHGAEAVHWLIEQGVAFTGDSANPLGFHLTREGGHSCRRIFHAADSTGHAIQQTLGRKVRTHRNITLLEQHMAVDLIVQAGRCVGLYVQSVQSGPVSAIAARQVVLANGGAGKVYLYTTNPDCATGDGVAMAWRAGCRIANMEFIQFHPTCLYHPYAKSFLISEAVRGEGGVLKLPPSAGADAGLRFMPEHDARAELAPRDIVARSIDFEMKRRGLDYVHLDVSHLDAGFLLEHFPTISARCREFGIDITREPIPVVPAAHYTCGGIVTDTAGHTDLPGLYAAGEVACTGLHGANRLASNSLLECVVLGRAVAGDILERSLPGIVAVPSWDDSRVRDSDEDVVIAHNWDELRRCMWNYVGIVRTTKWLERARRRIELLREEINEYYASFHVTRDLLELRNLVDVAELIVASALARHESRGLHYSLDWPQTLAKAMPTVISPRGMQRPASNSRLP